jgi:hypothetical protein
MCQGSASPRAWTGAEHEVALADLPAAVQKLSR